MRDIERAVYNLFHSAAAGNAAVIAFRILVGLIILVIASRIIEFICRRLLKHLSDKPNADQGAVRFLNTILKIMLYLAVILMILNSFGYKTSSLLTLLGSLGLAIVLGLKDSLGNVAAGIIIMILRPFKVGDYIAEKTYNCEGTVTDIGLFFTKMKTLDERTVVIPNYLLMSTAVINHTEEEYRTLDLRVAVTYGTDVDRAMEVVRKVIAEDQKAEKKQSEPEMARVFVYDLADSAVILCSRLRVLNQDYWPSRYRLLEKIYKSFAGEGIEFAYPHMDVEIKNSRG